MVVVDIKPIFGKADFRVDEKLAFVIMPFEKDLTDIYDNYVKPTVKNKGLRCERADDYKTSTYIMQRIWHLICKSRVIIADLTKMNSNVMYELGISHTLGKDTILIYQEGTKKVKFPLDVAGIYVIKYAGTVMGPHKLTTELSNALNMILEGDSTSLSSDEMLNVELRNYLKSEYTRRRKRIEWFSFHCLNILRGFLEEHAQLLAKLDTFNKEKSDQNIRAIMGKARTNAEDYIIPFIKSELDKVGDYLESAWLVNKFPDELSRIGDAMAMVRNSHINTHTRNEYLNDLMGTVKDKKEKIEDYMEMIQEERKVVGLPSLKPL